MLDSKISVYRNAKDNKGFEEGYKVQSIIGSIRTKYEEATNQLRALTDKDEIDEHKKTRFAGVTWAGVFSPIRLDKQLDKP